MLIKRGDDRVGSPSSSSMYIKSPYFLPFSETVPVIHSYIGTSSEKKDKKRGRKKGTGELYIEIERELGGITRYNAGIDPQMEVV